MSATPTESSTPRHVPVLLERCIALLAPALAVEGAVLVDATLGLGGHSAALLDEFPHLRVVGIDRDPQALELAAQRLAGVAERVTLVHAVNDELPRILADLGLTSVQGVLLDLGVSSMQLDEDDRGFSYSRDTDLDMRMDPTTGLTAADILNTYSRDQLAKVLREYGEERFARRIADAVVARRGHAPITSSAELVDLVRSSIPAPARRTGGNPAKRSFQALRIEVNDELGVLARLLPVALESLALHGRIVVMSYQSLEDRIVKRALVEVMTSKAPVDLPVVPEALQPRFASITRGAQEASAAEIEINPRAASVRLRGAERIRDAA
ncbi:MAG: 16S rRNA (cytosine(1402)-N(4))-methyltransferase RsmH [Actinomycetes bacterium]